MVGTRDFGIFTGGAGAKSTALAPRVPAKDVNDPNTFKVRKAKVGGYRDYFDDDQVAELDAMVDSNLLPKFGYTSAEIAEAR